MASEEEYSYRHNGLSSFGAFFGPGKIIGVPGNRNTNSIMTNLIYDFIGLAGRSTPHIGFGIGAVNTNDSVSLNPVTTSPGTAHAFRYSGRALPVDRGNFAIPEPDSRRDLPEGKHLEFRLSGDRRYPVRHQPIARL